MQSLNLGLLILITGAAFSVFAEKVKFDVAALESLGYSPDISEFFSETRFLPGVQDVTVEVNSSKSYSMSLIFDNNGNICVDEDFINRLHLTMLSLPAGCNSPTDLWKGSSVKVIPGSFRVELVLPENAFDVSKISGDSYGGTAAILNYEIYTQRFSSSFGRQNSLQSTLKPGLNINNWVIRNRSQFSLDNKKKFEIAETSAVRALPSLKSRIEIGEYGAENSIFSGLPLTGVQVMSEDHLVDGHLLIPFTGMVDSQSNIEVKQRGRTVYRTLVPPGPFSLDNLGKIIGGIEAEVIITESDGRVTSKNFIPQKLERNSEGQPHTQFGIGRYRSYSYNKDKSSPPIVIMGERQLNKLHNAEFVLGGLLSPVFQAVALQNSYLDFMGRLTYSRGTTSQGVEIEAQKRFFLKRSLGFSLSSRYRTAKAIGIDDGLDNTKTVSNKLRTALGASLSLSTNSWGAVSYNLYHTSYYHSKNFITHGLSTSYQLGKSTLSMSAQRSADKDYSLFANISVPLGMSRVGTRMQKSGRQHVATGISFQGNASEDWNYSLGATNAGNNSQFTGSTQVATPYNQVTGNIAYSNSGSQSFGASAYGGIAYSNNALLFSPYNIGSTFVIVDTGGVPGIGLNTMGAGSITTDYAGHALLPSVTPYTDNIMNVDTEKLPLNIRINTTSSSFKLAHGTVGYHRFMISEVKQLLLTIKKADGGDLPVGASVYYESGELYSTIIGDGNVMLVNDDIGKRYFIKAPNMDTCKIIYSIPDSFDPDTLYEESAGMCIPA